MIKVLVVEDSPTTRRFLMDLIHSAPGLLVAGEASNGFEAIRLAQELQPDVISMDIRMPRVDGLEATKHIMADSPAPIVIVSAGLGQREVDMTMLALEAGAVAAIEKPGGSPEDEHKRQAFIRMLRLMADVHVIRRTPKNVPSVPNRQLIKAHRNDIPEVVVIGASAGGPGALAQILSNLSPSFPLPILVVQHLSSDFVPGLVDWLDRRCALLVRLAPEGEMPVSGEVWFAPGGYHLTLDANRYTVFHDQPGTYRHQPSVDMLFNSVAQVYGSRTISVLLTGMGDDGAEGMAALHRAGAVTIAQDKTTCAVFGMPAAAIARQVVEQVLPLSQIAPTLNELARAYRATS